VLTIHFHPVGVRFSASGLSVHQASYTYRVSFSGVKWLGHGVNHPPSSSAKVKERVELYLYFPSGPSCPVLGQTLPLPFSSDLDKVSNHIDATFFVHW
jgi:hypothetical protein